MKKIEEENENKEVKEEQKIENNEIKNDTKNENDNKKKRKTWNNSEKKENIETNIEKEEQKSDNNIRGKRRTYNKEKEKSENNENNQDLKKENYNTENEQQKNKNEQKQIKKTNTLSTTFVPGSYTDKDKNINNADKDTSISSSENEKNIKAKSKKGVSGLNIIEESQDFLKEMLNDVEQYNVGNILKGDLAEVFQDVIKDNADFKDNIFFVNVGHTEKKVGDLDKTKKMHTFKEFPKQELLSGYNSYDQLLKKYIDRAKRYKDEDK